MHVIESDDYRNTRAALAADPIIRQMAAELPADWRLQFTHGGTDDQPNYYFMIRALDEYKGRGGTIQTHIGGPAEAIIQVRKETAVEQDPDETNNASLIHDLNYELRHAAEQASKHHYLNVIASLAKATTLALRIHQRQLRS